MTLDRMAQYERTIAPAFLDKGDDRATKDLLHKLPARVGRVIKVHAPGTPSNRNGKFIEYDVLVDEGSEHRTANRFTVPNCLVMSSFGGAADFSAWTPRQLSDKSIPLGQTTDKQDVRDFGLGSRVVILLVNGSTFAGIIIGGLPHNKGEGSDIGAGHRATWQFNGIRAEVDKDGQFTLSFKGATDAAGGLELGRDASRSGSKFQMLSDGSVNSIATKDYSVTAREHIALKAETSDATVDTPLGLIKTSGLGVHLGAGNPLGATDAMILGSTYRQNESELHASAITTWTQEATGWSQVAVAFGLLAPLLALIDPTGNLTAIFVQAAGVAASTSGQNIVHVGDVAAFEGGGPFYLSTRNKLD